MSDTPISSPTPQDEFGLEAVRELLRLISATDVTEIQIERGTTKLHIKRGAMPAGPIMITPTLAQTASPAPASSASTPFGHAPTALGHPAEFEPAAGSHVIVSPMVGTFYANPSPRDPAYVQEGDVIQAGDVVGIVEAMKIMNEVDSEWAGKITKILVSSGQPVEYGQPLIVVEPV